MAAPGWYPDPNDHGMLRWWDGTIWTDERQPRAWASPPQAMPRLRDDGTVKGPSRRTSLAVLFAGAALLVGGLVALVPGFFDAIDGPRFAIPGEQTLELGTGSWVLYQRTDRASATNPTGGPLSFELGDGVTLRPAQVSITGPGPVGVGGRSATTETITRGDADFTDAVHFEIEQAGTYTISVRGEPASGGEVLVARPVFHLFRLWPWLVMSLAGGGVIIAGIVMWMIGAGNRRTARRAGIDV